MIDNQGDVGILADISKPLESAGRGAFRLLVDGRVKTLAVEDEADRDDVGLAGLIGCRQVRDTGGAKESQFFLC